MKSGGQMSSQSPVIWWYHEVKCEVVGMSVEAGPVLVNESVDFFFNRCDLIIFVSLYPSTSTLPHNCKLVIQYSHSHLAMCFLGFCRNGYMTDKQIRRHW
jgi:hypothetical protein